MSRHTGRILFSEKNTSRNVLDANTNQRPYWVRGDDFQLEFALENQDGSFVTASQVGSIEIVVRAANDSESEPKRMTQTIGAEACDAGFSAGQWRTGSALAVATWTAAEAALEVPEGKSSQLYYIYAVHTSPSGYKTTYGSYEIEVRKAPHATPTLAAPNPPEETPLTQSQGDERYAAKGDVTNIARPLRLLGAGQSLNFGGSLPADTWPSSQAISDPRHRIWDTTLEEMVTFEPSVINNENDGVNQNGYYNPYYWFGARLVRDLNRPVETILAGKPGVPISYWQDGNAGWEALEDQFSGAGWDVIDVVDWKQGESNNSIAGTGYDGASEWLTSFLDFRSRTIAAGYTDENTVWLVHKCAPQFTVINGHIDTLKANPKTYPWVRVVEFSRELHTDDIHTTSVARYQVGWIDTFAAFLSSPAASVSSGDEALIETESRADNVRTAVFNGDGYADISTTPFSNLPDADFWVQMNFMWLHEQFGISWPYNPQANPGGNNYYLLHVGGSATTGNGTIGIRIDEPNDTLVVIIGSTVIDIPHFLLRYGAWTALGIHYNATDDEVNIYRNGDLIHTEESVTWTAASVTIARIGADWQASGVNKSAGRNGIFALGLFELITSSTRIDSKLTSKANRVWSINAAMGGACHVCLVPDRTSGATIPDYSGQSYDATVETDSEAFWQILRR